MYAILQTPRLSHAGDQQTSHTPRARVDLYGFPQQRTGGTARQQKQYPCHPLFRCRPVAVSLSRTTAKDFVETRKPHQQRRTLADLCPGRPLPACQPGDRHTAVRGSVAQRTQRAPAAQAQANIPCRSSAPPGQKAAPGRKKRDPEKGRVVKHF